jgi:phage shock protein C
MVWPSRNGLPLQRDPRRAVVSGVCAGLGDYVGIDPVIIRVAAATALWFYFWPTLIAYIVLEFSMPRKPRGTAIDAAPLPVRIDANQHEDEDDSEDKGEEREKRVLSPAMTLQSVQSRLSAVAERLARAEAHVASADFELRRELDRLKE